MSNYSITTNFGAKDALTSGDPNKLILGSQLTTEFNNIATAISTKLDAGSGFANPTASAGLAVVNGVATTAMRSDAAPAISQSISPTWTGNHTFSPSSGAALTLNGAATNIAVFNGFSTATSYLTWKTNTATTEGFIGTRAGTLGSGTGFGIRSESGFYVAAGGTEYFTINSAGNAALNAPSSGVTLDVAGLSGTAAIEAFGSSTFIQSRDTGGNGAITRLAASNTANYVDFTWSTTAVPGVLRHGGTDVVTISTTRAVTVAAPSSGVALTVSGASNANVISATASGTGAALVANSQIQDTWRAMRSSDSVITSNATLASDAVLTFSSLPAGSYEFTALIKFVGANTGAQGLKYAFAAGGTLTSSFFVANGLVNTAPSTSGTFIAMTNAISYTPINTTNGDGVLISGSFITSTAGSFAIQFAQNSSSVDSTTIKAGSRLEVRRIA